MAEPPPPFVRPEPTKPSGRPFVKVVLPEKPAREFRAFVGGAEAGIAAMGFEAADARRKLELDAAIKEGKGNFDRDVVGQLKPATYSMGAKSAVLRVVVRQEKGILVLECGHERAAAGSATNLAVRRRCFACERGSTSPLQEAAP